MNQHPVPQNIASYQFRLIGDMTLKQFLELASGIGLAFLTFNLHLPAFFKWPLMGVFSLMGFALAFLPVQERPLDTWIINFFRAIYSPTIFLWRKDNQPPDFLTKKTMVSHRSQTTIAAPQKDKKLLHEYLGTLTPFYQTTSLDQQEHQSLDNISKLLTNTPGAASYPAPAIPVSPIPTSQSISTSHFPSPASQPQSPIPVKKPIIKSAPPLTPPISVETLFPVQQKVQPQIAAMFSGHITMPALPEYPNLVVGMVLTPDQKILANALIEIKNSQGATIRALKTNQLGQFFTAAQLDNGTYQILVEHDRFSFAIINLRVEGKIIPPLKIVAQKELA